MCFFPSLSTSLKAQWRWHVWIGNTIRCSAIFSTKMPLP
jgi:hypothetical protein